MATPRSQAAQTPLDGQGAAVRPLARVLVATDRSQTAERAVVWAATLAARCNAELVVLQVVVNVGPDGADLEIPDDVIARAQSELQSVALRLGGARARGRVVVSDDPARAILEAIDEEDADTVVVGNLGMAGRRQFLLGNIPNRISHNARCNVIIVNTGGAGAQVRYWGASGAPAEGRLLGRALHIGRVMARAGVRELLQRPAGDDEAASRERARRLRNALDQLGPTFAKLGQILSTRQDLLPAAFIEELATLQDRVTPLTETEVVAVLEQELGVPWEDVFASIDPEPLAAGTIAQVHRATLEGGERVVVKVQRPAAEQYIMQDLGLLERFVQKTGGRPAFRRVFDLPAMIEHLSSSLRRELDFRQEANNLRRMAEVLQPFSRLAVPAVYDQYSTARVLVMEEIGGVPVRQAPAGAARSEAARQLLEAYYQQVMAAGFFHADPHPGNMKWWNDRIYLLDLGMVGEVEPEVRELLLMLLLAFAQEDAAFLSDVLLMLGGSASVAGDEDGLEGFRDDLAALIARYRSLSLKDIQLGPILQEVTAISVKHNVRLPASIALTGKAFAQMQLAAGELDPSLDPFSVASRFVVRKTARELMGSLKPQSLFYEAQKARLRIGRAVEALEGITGARPGSRLQVNFRGTERLEDSISRAGRRLSAALTISGALVGAGLYMNSRRPRRR
jgi:predicted unusual protein kinase regulating ubiquinone biosynthesis (AarF/ABC1/UbiB family)/nucleotide-binding universal stress UspA family protein